MVTKKENEWTIGSTGMSKKQARRAAKVIEAACPGVFAHAVDPRHFYTISADRWTAEMLRDALRLLADKGGDARGVLEDIEDWLQNSARPYAEDEDAYPSIQG